jgi:hypothetical protein
MSKKLHYIRFFLKNAPSTIHANLHHKAKQIKHFRGVKNITTENSGAFLKEKILSGEPFCAIRFGGSEISCLNNYEKINLALKRLSKTALDGP